MLFNFSIYKKPKKKNGNFSFKNLLFNNSPIDNRSPRNQHRNKNPHSIYSMNGLFKNGQSR